MVIDEFSIRDEIQSNPREKYISIRLTLQDGKTTKEFPISYRRGKLFVQLPGNDQTSYKQLIVQNWRPFNFIKIRKPIIHVYQRCVFLRPTLTICQEDLYTTYYQSQTILQPITLSFLLYGILFFSLQCYNNSTPSTISGHDTANPSLSFLWIFILSWIFPCFYFFSLDGPNIFWVSSIKLIIVFV